MGSEESEETIPSSSRRKGSYISLTVPSDLDLTKTSSMAESFAYIHKNNCTEKGSIAMENTNQIMSRNSVSNSCHDLSNVSSGSLSYENTYYISTEGVFSLQRLSNKPTFNNNNNNVEVGKKQPQLVFRSDPNLLDQNQSLDTQMNQFVMNKTRNKLLFGKLEKIENFPFRKQFLKIMNFLREEDAIDMIVRLKYKTHFEFSSISSSRYTHFLVLLTDVTNCSFLLGITCEEADADIVVSLGIILSMDSVNDISLHGEGSIKLKMLNSHPNDFQVNSIQDFWHAYHILTSFVKNFHIKSSHDINNTHANKGSRIKKRKSAVGVRTQCDPASNEDVYNDRLNLQRTDESNYCSHSTLDVSTTNDSEWKKYSDNDFSAKSIHRTESSKSFSHFSHFSEHSTPINSPLPFNPPPQNQENQKIQKDNLNMLLLDAHLTDVANNLTLQNSINNRFDEKETHIHYRAQMSTEYQLLYFWYDHNDLCSTVPVHQLISSSAGAESNIRSKISREIREVFRISDPYTISVKQILEMLEDRLKTPLKEHWEFIDNEILMVFGQLEKPSQILDYLFLGTEFNAADYFHLCEANISHVLNATNEIDNFFNSEFKYFNVAIYDEESSDLLSHFSETYNFIQTAKRNNSKVLVHCQRGVSRSATVVIAYLMKEFNWSKTKAFNYVKSIRPIVKPNSGFLEQLDVYEGILKSQQTKSVFA